MITSRLLRWHRPMPASTMSVGLSHRQHPYAINSVQKSSNSRFLDRPHVHTSSTAVGRAVDRHRWCAITIDGGSAPSMVSVRTLL